MEVIRTEFSNSSVTLDWIAIKKDTTIHNVSFSAVDGHYFKLIFEVYLFICTWFWAILGPLD